MQTMQPAITGLDELASTSWPNRGTNQPDDGYPTNSCRTATSGQDTLTHGLIDFRAKTPAGLG